MEFMSFIVAAVLAIVIVIHQKSKMNNATKQSFATQYIKENSFSLRDCRDSYLYSTTTRVRIQQNNGGGHGGSRGGGPRGGGHRGGGSRGGGHRGGGGGRGGRR